ncbi:MAG TPA: SDR family NAD(P)-dependent oxidoreductase [Dehalococcoidia bacterium]|nr:SDR family NAD(P)-dependent oxidoreductase [Dehalococcoidia bacterium]
MALALEGKTAIVTGSSRGIGKMIALQLARDGANVVVCSRTEKVTDLPGTIGETAAAIEAMGRKALAVRMDLASDEDMRSMLDQTMATFGGVDVLVNNAVIVGPRAKFVGGSAGFMDLSYRVNVRAPYVLCQMAGAKMAEAGGGSIVQISSGAARYAQPPTAPATELDAIDPAYGFSKAALERFSTAYAAELWASNISIVCLRPGLVITERIEVAAIRPNVDFSRAEPGEVTAKAASFMALNGLRFTGQVLTSREVYDGNNLKDW